MLLVKDTKPTAVKNPKDVLALSRLPMGLVPDSMAVYASTGFLEGALKYGRYNWRIAGVSASIYNDALQRHVADWWGGEDYDPKTGVHNLASALCCIGIILDAEVCGKLTDDRPPAAPISELIDAQADLIKHLQELLKEHNPHQYTIKDSQWKTNS